MKLLYIILIFFTYVFLLYIGENTNDGVNYYFYNILIFIITIIVFYLIDYVFLKFTSINLFKKTSICLVLTFLYYIIYIQFDSDLIVYLKFFYVLPIFTLIIFYNIIKIYNFQD